MGDHEAPRSGPLLSTGARRYIYGILVAGGAVALTYGIVTAEELAVWLGLGGSILGNGLALANTPKESDGRR